MGDYVTQRRKRDLVVFDGLEKALDDSWSSPYSAHIIQEQVTTSYRSSKELAPWKPFGNAEILHNAGVGVNAYKVQYPYDTGHEFQTEDCKILVHPRHKTVYGPLEKWEGGIAITSDEPSSDYLPLPHLDLVQMGTRMIAQTIPTRSLFSISEVLAQLRTGQELPGVAGVTKSAKAGININLFWGNTLQDTISRFLNIGSKELLNVEYGWNPFVKDMKDILSAVQMSNKAVQQYIRDSGRNVHRKSSFPREIVNTVIRENAPIGAGHLNHVLFDGNRFGPVKGHITTIDTVTTDVWFRGTYTYHIPNGDSLAAKFNEYVSLAEKMTGFEIDPAVLWELTPWSWLIDWFTDIGTIIGNATEFQRDNLVMRYGYLMCRQTYTRRSISTDCKIGSYVPGFLSTTFTRTRKSRIRATPYGFGINLDSLSDNQWAILAALGISLGHGDVRR